MKTYRIISQPFFTLHGTRTDDSDYRVGEIVHADLTDVDDDGDVPVRRLDAEDQGDRLNPSCLTEVDVHGRPVAPRNDVERVSVEAVRAVLALHMDPDQIDRVIGVIARVDTALLS